jgi:hypothetical protein
MFMLRPALLGVRKPDDAITECKADRHPRGKTASRDDEFSCILESGEELLNLEAHAVNWIVRARYAAGACAPLPPVTA